MHLCEKKVRNSYIKGIVLFYKAVVLHSRLTYLLQRTKFNLIIIKKCEYVFFNITLSMDFTLNFNTQSN